MKKKSKFLSFILSFIPGLGQIYLGFAARGAMFLASCITVPTLLLALRSGLQLWQFDESLVFLSLFLIWLVAMVDTMLLVDRINGIPSIDGTTFNEHSLTPDYSVIIKQNKKVVAMLLSILPGAGHLYLGLQRQGIELMAGFFLSFYLTDWLNLSIFLIFAPIIWFSSLFDVMHKVSGDRTLNDDSIFSDHWFKNNVNLIGENSFLRNKHKIVGYALVIVGSFLILDKFVYSFIKPYLDERITNNIQTGVIAILLILGGIKLLIGSKDLEKR
jgi:hypothetical protein